MRSFWLGHGGRRFLGQNPLQFPAAADFTTPSSSLPSSRFSTRGESGQLRIGIGGGLIKVRVAGHLRVATVNTPTAVTRCGQDSPPADGLPGPSTAPWREGVAARLRWESAARHAAGNERQLNRASRNPLVDGLPRTMPPNSPLLACPTSSGGGGSGRETNLGLWCTCPVTMDMCSDSGPWHPAR